MFNIFKSKKIAYKFDITKEPQYLDLQDEFERLRLKYNDLKEDNVSFQLLPASVFDDAGNEYFLQLRSDRTQCRISYQAKPGPLELFKAYGDTIPQAIKNLYKLGILNHVSKSFLRNPESEYELRSVKDYIDSFDKKELLTYNETEETKKLERFIDAAKKHPKFLSMEDAKDLEKFYNELETPNCKGPESEDDLINKADTKPEIWYEKDEKTGELQGYLRAKDITKVGELVVPEEDDDLPGIGGTKFTIKVDKDMFQNIEVTDIVEESPINISRKDLINALERSRKKKYSKKIKNN